MEVRRELVEQLGGLDLSWPRPVAHPQVVDLPHHLPVLVQAYVDRIDIPWVVLHAGRVFGVTGRGLTPKHRRPLRDVYRLSPSTKVALQFYVEDRVLAGVWANRHSVIHELSGLEQQRLAFNEAVAEAKAVGTWTHPAGYFKNWIAETLGQRSGIGYDKANAFVASWASTSSDTSDKSVALQVATAQKFGLDLTSFVAKKNEYFANGDPNFAQTLKDARAFIDAQYEQTQEWFAKRKITHLHLFRGMSASVGAKGTVDSLEWAKKPLPVKVHHNPLNSWSVNQNVAVGFGTYLLTASVPVSKVVGCCFTGLGCLAEQEFVIVGGADVSVMAAETWHVPYASLNTGYWDA